MLAGALGLFAGARGAAATTEKSTASSRATLNFPGARSTAPDPATNAAPAPVETSSPEMLRAYLQVREELRATASALERNRQETEAAAARATEQFETRLQLLEDALTDERRQTSEALQSSERLMLTLAAVFAGIGLLAILGTAYVQRRMMNRLAEEIAQTALAPRGPSTPAVGLPEGRLSAEAAAQVAAARRTAQMELLLGKGQVLLDLDRAEEALACFDEVLKLEPGHAEALVRKGQALEQARKPDEAIVCYDRAIAADHTFTMAYLHKGGLCNRLERHAEALQCYEEALKAHGQSR